MKKIRVCFSLLMVLCFCLICGCSGYDQNLNSANKAEQWCLNQVAEFAKSTLFDDKIKTIVSYDIQEMVLSEDYLKNIHEDETAKCYYISFIGDFHKPATEINEYNYFIESYCVIAFRDNKNDQIIEDDIAFFSGVVKKREYEYWSHLKDLGTRTYICEICATSQKVNFFDARYGNGDYTRYLCPKCRWRYEEKLFTESEEEYKEKLQNAKDNYAKGLNVYGEPIKTES